MKDLVLKVGGIINSEVIIRALMLAVKKLDPRYMIKSPLLFIVWIIAAFTFGISVYDLVNPKYEMHDPVWFSMTISISIWFALVFANFAESMAEFRGESHAKSLKTLRKELTANKIVGKGEEMVFASDLRKGDVVRVSAGEHVPCDGEVIEGVASVDESAITGESAPVIRENSMGRSTVTAVTKVISDSILIRVLNNPGSDFLDKMISMVQGAEHKPTPNEQSLNIFLIGLTIIYIVVCFTLMPISEYLGLHVSLVMVVSLLVCLMPTTIGSLISPIAISGMERLLSKNVLALSGRAVESAGDVDVLFMDKTGTITMGNRMPAELIPIKGITEERLAKTIELASLADDTPEGQSIMQFIREKYGTHYEKLKDVDINFIPFSAETQMSGCDYKGTHIRKGAVNAISRYLKDQGVEVPKELMEITQKVGAQGATPLAVMRDNKILGVINLKDTIKPAIAHRFERLKSMGIKVVLMTGDNYYTAQTITKEAGLEDFICEADPERKLEHVKNLQAEGNVVAVIGDGTNDAPAIAQADVGFAMNNGTQAVREAANMIDMDNDPTKLIEVIEVGKQMLMTRGCLTTFSMVNDIAKYFAIVPAIFVPLYPEIGKLNIMGLSSPYSAIISAVIFNALIIMCLVPIALKGVRYRPIRTARLLKRFFAIYGLGGLIAPFIGIKLIDIIISGIIG